MECQDMYLYEDVTYRISGNEIRIALGSEMETFIRQAGEEKCDLIAMARSAQGLRVDLDSAGTFQ